MKSTVVAAATRFRPTELKASVSKGIPSDATILAIQKAAAGEYELTDKEAKTLRSRIYSINRENLAGFKFRTMREGSLLMVWRIH